MLAIRRDHGCSTAHGFDKDVAETFSIRTEHKSARKSEKRQRVFLEAQEVHSVMQTEFIGQTAQAVAKRS